MLIFRSLLNPSCKKLRHFPHVFFGVLGLFLLTQSNLANASQESWSLLRQAATAGQHQSFEGTYLHSAPNTLETFLMTRTVKGRLVHEKRVSLDGPSREIVRKDNIITCYAHNQEGLELAKININQPFPEILPVPLTHLNQSYQLLRQGTDRVAQRPCYRLELRPKDPYRYSFLLCTDKEKALPLKVAIIAPGGKTVEQFAFTSIQFTPSHRAIGKHRSFQKRFSLSSDTLPAKQENQLSAQMEQAISGLPKDFRLAKVTRRPLPSKPDQSAYHLVFSDGMVLLSLFIERHDVTLSTVGQNATLTGALNMATRQESPYQLTLVGNLPKDHLVTLLEKIKIIQPL